MVVAKRVSVGVANEGVNMTSEIISSGTLHFTIEGEYITRVARDMFLSDMPSKAWRLIVNSLVGGPEGTVEHVAGQVLDGKKKLTGDSHEGIYVADDEDAAEYIRMSKFAYAGRVKVDGTWWRPKAEVTGVGPDDAHYAMKKYGPLLKGSSGMKIFGRLRIEYYAKTGDRVFDVMREIGRRTQEQFIIFEPCGEPPIWWKENTTPSDALKDFLKVGKKLDKESWSDRFSSYVDPDEDENVDAEPTEEDIAAEKADIERRHDFIDAAYAKEAAERKARHQLLRDAIIAQMTKDGSGMIDILDESGTLVVSAPRAPFMNWALRRTSLKHLAPPWETVCPSGMKLPLDDPYHTDWWLGAGLELDESPYGSDVDKAAHHTMYELHHQLGGYDCAVIVTGEDVYGTVGKEIVVAPDLQPDRLESISAAKAVITETGGALAHLAQVALERGIVIVLVPDACTRYKTGMRLSVKPSVGEIEINVMSYT